MKNLTLKVRLGLLLLIAISLTLLIGAVGLYGMSAANQALQNVYQDRAKPLIQIDAVERLSTENQQLVSLAIQDATDAAMRRC